MNGTGTAEHHWDPQHPVLRILRARRAANSKPGARADSAKVALAVEGGGIRGITSAGMLNRLDDAGFTSAFDVVYGTSSGAVNAAFFVAKDTWSNVSIYYEHLLTKKFIDLKRAMRGRSIMNLDYLFDHVLDSVKPLNYQAAIKSQPPLVVPVTDIDSLRTVLYRSFSSADNLKSVLRASTWLPIAVRGAMEHEGRRLIDGGVLTALPFRLALNDGCTHVLSLSTRKAGPPARQGIPAVHRYVYLHLERIRRGLGHGYLKAFQQRHSDEKWLAAQRFPASSQRPHVLDLAPLPWMTRLILKEMDPYRVINCGREAYALAYCATEGLSPIYMQSGAVNTVLRMTMPPSTSRPGDVIRPISAV